VNLKLDINMNEEEEPDTEAAPASALLMLQDMVHERIKQKKGEIHESHNKVYN
jgi:hypothetical protein